MSCELRDLVDLVPFAPAAPAGPNLYEKLAAAMVEIRSPSKDGEMRMSDNGKPIAYVKNDDLMESIRKPLAKQGVAFLVDLTEIKRGDKGGIGVWVEMTFTDGRERHIARWYGEGRSVPIACTFAVKYYLMKVLLVGAGEADDEGADDGAAVRAIRAEAERHPAAKRIRAQSRGRKPQAQDAPAKAAPVAKPAQAAPEAKATDLAMKAQAPLDKEPPPPSPLLDELRELMALVDAVEVNTTDEHGKEVVVVDREASYQRVKDRLRAWAEEEPGIVATDEKGEPAPRLSSDDQLARLVGRYRDLAEPETEGYDL